MANLTARQLVQLKAQGTPPRPVDTMTSTPVQRVKQLREQFGLTMIEVANELKMPTTALNLVENKGIGKTQLATAIRLARFYETTLDDLFGTLIRNNGTAGEDRPQ